MQFKLIATFTLLTILHNQHELADAKAMIGENVRQVREREFNFVVSLLHINEPGDLSLIDYACSGTLITPRDVLTSDHCLEDEEVDKIQVLVGSIYLTQGRKYYPRWWKTYNDWIAEKQLYLRFKSNDLAIIRLTENVPAEITPAVISSVSLANLYGQQSVIAGWGLTNNGALADVMKTATVTILPNSECERRAENLIGIQLPIHSRIMCSAADPYALLMPGDSGGPLLYANQIVAVNTGTYPHTEVNTYPEKVNVHFSIEYYKDFILDFLIN